MPINGQSPYSSATAAKPASATIASPAWSDMAIAVNLEEEETVALVTVLLVLVVEIRAVEFVKAGAVVTVILVPVVEFRAAELVETGTVVTVALG